MYFLMKKIITRVAIEILKIGSDILTTNTTVFQSNTIGKPVRGYFVFDFFLKKTKPIGISADLFMKHDIYWRM